MNLFDLLINHPGRDQSLQYTDYHSTPATPPSKGGETFVISVLPIQPYLGWRPSPQGGLFKYLQSQKGDLGVIYKKGIFIQTNGTLLQ